MSNNAINWDEWQNELEKLNHRATDVIPPGWIIPAQLREEKNISESHARRLLLDLWRGGRAERKQFNKVWHYRLLPSGKSRVKVVANGKAEAKVTQA